MSKPCTQRAKRISKHIVHALLVFVCAFGVTAPLHAEEKMSAADSVAAAKKAMAKDNKDSKFRDFYEVLEDVYADFEYDLKNSQVQGLQNLSVRNIAVSEQVPQSFRAHLELITTERIMKHTKTQIIECLPCRARKASLSGEKLIITSPETDPAHLARIAKQAGILHFMDISFAYQTSGLILSLVITDADTGAVVWSRSYNSEHSRAAAQRRGVDFEQIDKARKSGEYEPTILYRPTAYFIYAQGANGFVGNLGVGLRIAERYDNRRKEVGFELTYLMSVATLTGQATATPDIFGGFNLSLLFVHAWNFIGSLENFNEGRTSLFVGVGGMYASGYLAGLARLGVEYRMGKRWSISGLVGYRPPATAMLGGTATPVSGVEFGVSVSALFF